MEMLDHLYEVKEMYPKSDLLFYMLSPPMKTEERKWDHIMNNET